MGAMVLFGVPPEDYWPYTDSPDPNNGFDVEPPAFCYAFGQSYQPIRYYKLDPPTVTRPQILDSVRLHIAAGLPSMFGFTVYSSIRPGNVSGKIPFPCAKESVLGGHAIVAIGYDDKMKIRNPDCSLETTGALLIRNSWGTGWGDKGYGWLLYDYIQKGLAVDWWTLVKNEYIDTREFGF